MAIHHSFKISKNPKPTKAKATKPKPVPSIGPPVGDLTDRPTSDFQWDTSALEKSRLVFPLAPEAWETTFAVGQDSVTSHDTQSSDDTTIEIEEKPVKHENAIPGWLFCDTRDVPVDVSEAPPEAFDWVSMFFAPKEDKSYEPQDLSGHFEETLALSLEPYSPGLVVNPVTDGFVVSGKSTHAFFHPISGAMTPWMHQPAPRNAKDKATETVLRTIMNTDCLNVGDPSYWWNFRVSDKYVHLSEVSNNRVVAALFNISSDACYGPTELSIVRCFQPYSKEALTTSQFYSFTPQHELMKYQLALAGSPNSNLFLIESYKDDTHYIYLLTNSLNSALPHFKRVLTIKQISRKQENGNLRGTKWWRHRILTFGENLAIFKEGRLAVWRLVYEKDIVTAHLCPGKYGFIADVHPVQFGKYLIFSRGVLDMSTFQFRTIPISLNDRKKIIWHKREGNLVGSTVPNLSFQCFYLGEDVVVE